MSASLRSLRISFIYLLTLCWSLDLQGTSRSAMSDLELSMVPFFTEVLAQAGFGLRQVEEAAFIVAGDDRPLACVSWPGTGQPRQQKYRGPVPAATIAIVHSHPISLRAPSTNDIEQARRVGLPFYVITRDSIWRADPDGSTHEVLRGDGWWRPHARAARGCRTTAQFVVDTARRGDRLAWRDAKLSTP